MSPEMDLLDQLLGGDESLHLALLVFGWPEEADALERARHSLTQQIKDGLVLLKVKDGTGERILSEWETSQVLRDDQSWAQPEKQEARYFLSLTEGGSRYVG